MPQPLSRIKPDAKVKLNARVLDDKPEFAKLVAAIFSHWAATEANLNILLIRVLGAAAKPALAMFATLTAQHLQRGALEAAAKAALSDDEFDILKAALAVADGAQAPRNELAHWMWAGSADLPDALLLVDPDAFEARDRNAVQMMAEIAARPPTERIEMFDFLAELREIEPDDVNVYRLPDLERACRDAVAAHEITGFLALYLDGVFKGQLDLSRSLPLDQIRDEIFHRLYGQRLFREAWDRRRSDQQKPRQSSPGPQPTEPTE